jgi:hypothetical protein
MLLCLSSARQSRWQKAVEAGEHSARTHGQPIRSGPLHLLKAISRKDPLAGVKEHATPLPDGDCRFSCGCEKRIGIRAAATRGNDRKRHAFYEFVILARVAAACEESRSFFGHLRQPARKSTASDSSQGRKRAAAASSRSRLPCAGSHFSPAHFSLSAQPFSYGAAIRPIARRCWNFHSRLTFT